MKNLAYLTIILALVGYATAQRASQYEWKATVTVVDEQGQPVSGAKTWVAFGNPTDGRSSDPFRPNDWAMAGLTDANGLFKTAHRDGAVFLGVHAQKAGHYSTWVQHNIGFSPQDHPERLNAKITLILKRIIKPTPMYAKSVNLGMPALETPLGFDLMAGDWVAPYGKGRSTDVIFSGHIDKRAEGASDYKLTVSFPNAGDGIQEFVVPRLPAGEGSGLRSPHQAPAEGYQAEWVQTDSRKPGQPAETSRDDERNYFFRVRTILDEQGNVRSALYGKIYGDFMQFHYYLNPSINDRNVEFDPRLNLLPGLRSSEQVREP